MRILVFCVLMFCFLRPSFAQKDACKEYLGRFNFKEAVVRITHYTGNYQVKLVGPNLKNFPCRGRDIVYGIVIDLGENFVVKVSDSGGKEVQNLSFDRVEIRWLIVEETFQATLFSQTRNFEIPVYYNVDDGVYVLKWNGSSFNMDAITFW